MKPSFFIGLLIILLFSISGFTFGDKDKDKDKDQKKKNVEGVEAPYKLKLHDIVVRFQGDVYEVEKCRVLMKNASSLAREVKKFMRSTSALTQEEKEAILWKNLESVLGI